MVRARRGRIEEGRVRREVGGRGGMFECRKVDAERRR